MYCQCDGRRRIWFGLRGNFMKHLILITVLMLTIGGRLEADDASVFLKTHCVNCHGIRMPKGNLRLDVVSVSSAASVDAEMWQAIIDRVDAGRQ